MLQRLLDWFERIGAEPGDPPDLLLRKRLLVGMSFLIAILAVLWGALYLAFSEPLAAAIPWTYTVGSAISITVFGAAKNYRVFRFTQLTLILLLPFALQLTLGGFVDASAVVLWSLLAPLGAMLVSGRRQAVPWFIAYAAIVVIAQLLQPSIDVTNNLPTVLIVTFFVMNIVGVSLVSFVALHYFVGQKDVALDLLGAEQEKSERLLLNVLPRDIAAVLRDDDQTIAEHHPAVSVLFADIVGFTPMSARLAPAEMVELLNEIFSYFDDLVERYGCEKIRTIGDNYMVAAGVPNPMPDHAEALAAMALDMQAHAAERVHVEQVRFRLGINSGPAVAGVIGRKKFQYDLWGDTVNIASRMESHGVPGRIQITATTYELIKHRFACEPRGAIDVKGMGLMETWFVAGARQETDSVRTAGVPMDPSTTPAAPPAPPPPG